MIDRACISITSKCQLKCRYCHFDKHIKRTNDSDISIENLQKIIANIIDYAALHKSSFKIGLVGAGEPLLRFDLVQKAIGFAETTDVNNLVSFYIITNGITLDEKTITWFFKHKERIQLCFSLDGSEKNHNFCRVFPDGQGTFDSVMEHIALYKRIFGETPAINATVHRQTIDNTAAELKFYTNHFNKVCFSFLVDENSPDLQISRREFDEFIKKAAQTGLNLRQLRYPLKYDCTMYGQLCGVGRTNIFYANGKIYPCGRFIGMKSFELGDETSDLEQIEKMIATYTPVGDGKCFFDEKVGAMK